MYSDDWCWMFSVDRGKPFTAFFFSGFALSFGDKDSTTLIWHYILVLKAASLL